MKKMLLAAILILSLLSGSPAYADTGTAQGPVLVLENGTTLPVGYVDKDRLPDQIGIYTYRYGKSTPPFQSGTAEFIVIGDVVVEKNTNGTGGTPIPSGSYVLSVSGGALATFSGMTPGQTVKVLNAQIEVRPEKYAVVRGAVVKIDKRNATRGTGEVILFDPSHGPTTKQNGWGMEITVVGGVVSRVVGLVPDPAKPGNYVPNDSPIPQGGYVLSIQTRSPYFTLLNGKVKAGDSAEIALEPLQYRVMKIGYDGLNSKVRGADMLIVYDRTYGERTGTNPYGNEVVVNGEGMAVSNGGNNRSIPDTGIVLSGVGIKGTWLKDNVPVGSRIRIDSANKQIVAIVTPQSVLDKASYYAVKLRQQLQQSKAEFRDVPYARVEQQITVAESIYGQAVQLRAAGSVQELAGVLQQLDRAISDAELMHEESRVMETRGIWIRPKEKTREQVRDNLLKVKSARFNTVYLEAWWNGRTIYPTHVPDAAQNPIYNGFDVLQAYIEEGKSLGLDIHAWVENFRGGDETPGPALAAHPDWGIMSRQGHAYEIADNAKKYYFNPALPAVRDHLSAIYNELITKYEIAGLHLDFTRYPHSRDYSNDFGYDPYTKGLFQQKYGADPLALKQGDALWDTWLRFRTEMINSWVDRVVAEARAAKPQLFLSAAVWPNYDTAPALFAQEAKTWAAHNAIDQFVHMSYVRDASLLVGDLNKSLDIAGGKAFVASGIGAYMNLQPTMIAEQIREVNRAGGNGTSMFEFEATFGGGYDRVLALGAYRNEAVPPDYRKTGPLIVWVKDMIRKIDEIYVPLQGMSGTDATKYKVHLNVIVKTLEARESFTPLTASAAKQQLEVLRTLLSHDRSVHAEVKNRMMSDMEYGLQVLELYDAKMR